MELVAEEDPVVVAEVVDLVVVMVPVELVVVVEVVDLVVAEAEAVSAMTPQVTGVVVEAGVVEDPGDLEERRQIIQLFIQQLLNNIQHIQVLMESILVLLLLLKLKLKMKSSLIQKLFLMKNMKLIHMKNLQHLKCKYKL